MTDLLLGILIGYALALITIYATTACTRRLSAGQPILPRLRKPKPDSDHEGYRSNYSGYTP